MFYLFRSNFSLISNVITFMLNLSIRFFLPFVYECNLETIIRNNNYHNVLPLEITYSEIISFILTELYIQLMQCYKPLFSRI